MGQPAGNPDRRDGLSNNPEKPMKKTLFLLLQQLLPQHALSRLVGRLAECRVTWLKNFLISRFIKAYGVNMQEAQEEAPEAYANFNAFFTRPLKDGLRPLPADPRSIVLPADGAISAIGRIEEDSIFQAKGKSFSLKALIGGDESWAQRFRNGHFATVYLSPKDYHRVHMPFGGLLRECVYVPGDLYSVNQTTAENIDGLFARNERAVCLFDSDAGPMAVILVGAMIVAGIETVFAGHVAPAGRELRRTHYIDIAHPVRLERGAELGRFKLGSTAIVLFGPDAIAWDESLRTGSATQMGQRFGSVR
jgi:phosphatidylserine decarboxylase